MQNYIGEIAAILVAISWAFGGLLFEKGGKQIGSLSVNIIRIGLAILFLGFTTLITRGSFFPFDATREQWFWLLLSGFVGFFLGDLCLFSAYTLIGARLSALIMTLAPVITTVFGYLVLNEQLSWLKSLGIGIVISGILIAMLGRKGEKLRLHIPLKGFLLAVGGAIGQAFGLLSSKKGIGNYDPLAATQIRAIAGFVCFAVLFTFIGRWGSLRAALRNRKGLKEVVAGTVLGPFIGVSLAMFSLQHTNTGIAATLMGLAPIFIIIPSVTLFKQKVTAAQIIGAVISVGGTVLFFV